MPGDMQTVYCVPIDETGQEIKEDPVLQMPLGNVYAKEEATNTLLRLLLNFGGISFLIIMTMVGTPFFYRTFIVDIIKNENSINNTEFKKEDRLYTSEIFTSILIILTSLLLLSGFYSSFKDEFGAMIGIFCIILFFIAFARIQFEKTKSPAEFYSEYLGDSSITNWGGSLSFGDKLSMFGWLFYRLNSSAIGIMYVVLFGMIIFYNYVLSDSGGGYTNIGIMFFIVWFPLYLNALLFKVEPSKKDSNPE